MSYLDRCTAPCLRVELLSLLSLSGNATTSAGHNMAVVLSPKTLSVFDFAFRIGLNKLTSLLFLCLGVHKGGDYLNHDGT